MPPTNPLINAPQIPLLNNVLSRLEVLLHAVLDGCVLLRVNDGLYRDIAVDLVAGK